MKELDKKRELSNAYEYLSEFSLDSQHYLSINKESTLFYSKSVKGMISYILIGKRAMSIGDPVCKVECLEAFTKEYLSYCKDNNIKAIFNSVSEKMLDVLNRQEFTVLQYGQEAILDLSNYTLAGGKKAALRRNYNSVEKSFTIVKEYCPLKYRDKDLEEEINKLSKEWYSNKSYRVCYTIGELDFDTPHDNRFFYSRNNSGELVTFLSFMPYRNEKAYCIDVMLRKLDGKTGIMEHAIISASNIMKDDGIDELSLGIAPLSGIDISRSDTPRAELIMNDVFHNMDIGYNFKNLYRFKKKFVPSHWKPRFLVYHNKISLANLAMSINNTKVGSTDFRTVVKYKAFLINHKLRNFSSRGIKHARSV